MTKLSLVQAVIVLIPTYITAYISDKMIYSLKAFCSLFVFNESKETNARAPVSRIPLKQHVAVVLPLCLTLGEACLIACNVPHVGTRRSSNNLKNVSYKMSLKMSVNSSHKSLAKLWGFPPSYKLIGKLVCMCVGGNKL